MRRFFVASAFYLLISLGLVQAQQTDTPTVTLPDLSDDVRAVENAPVAVPVPDLLPVPLPSVSPPLPQEQQITIPESALTEAAGLDDLTRPSRSDTYGEAMVGASLWNGVAANLSLYRPGADPSFSIMFSHETLDGFAYHETGSGYSSRETMLQGDFRGGISQGLLWSLSAAFNDQSNGLQGQSQDFYGISHRYLTLIPGIRFPLGAFTVYSELETTTAALSLERGQSTVTGDVRAQELGLHPKVGIEWVRDTIRLSLEGNYQFYGLINNPETISQEDRVSQQGEAILAASFDISPAFQTGASVGIGTNSDLTWYVPFVLWFDAGLFDVLSVSVKGGLESTVQSLRELWELNPYTDIGPVSPIDAHWFAGGTIHLYPWKALTLRLQSDWQTSYGGTGWIMPLDEWNSNRGLYSYEQRSYDLLNTRLELRNSWQRVDAGLGLASQWMDKKRGRSQELYGSLEYRDEGGRFGAAGTFAFPFDSQGIDTPILDMNAFIDFGGGIRLIVDVTDLFMAFQGTEGRIIWEPYLETGFQAGLRLQFTL